MLPSAIPQLAPGPTPPGPIPPEPIPPGPVPPGPTPPGGSQTSVDLAFTADRTKLYIAWSALANLADLAGTVTVTVHAEKSDGFDKSKLQNGVIEPLREADLIE
jgi:hypothetical protein